MKQRTKGSPVSAAEKKAWQAMRDEGFTIEHVAKHHGASVAVVGKHTRLIRTIESALSRDQAIEKGQALRDEGKPISVIARSVERSVSWVCRNIQPRAAASSANKACKWAFEKGSEVVVASGGYMTGRKGKVTGYKPARKELARGFVLIGFGNGVEEWFTDSFVAAAA